MQGVSISNLFGHFIPQLSRQQHADFSALVDCTLCWDDYEERLFPRDGIRPILFASMASDSHFTATEADTMNKFIPPQGIRHSELVKHFLGPSLDQEQYGACVVLWNSILNYDKEKELYFPRKTRLTADTLPSVEEIRNQIPPQGLSITAFFDHFLPRVRREEHATFVVYAKQTLRYYKEMQLLFRKSTVHMQPGPSCLPTTELILGQIPDGGITPKDLAQCFSFERADAKAFLKLVGRVAVFDKDKKMIFPHPRFTLDTTLAHAVGRRCRICKENDSGFADCV